MEKRISKKTILVVDDIPENIAILIDILSADYKVKVTTQGKTALKISKSNDPPHLILLDIIMPEMDGYEVCRRLKADISTKKIPVIFVTSRNEEVDQAKGFEIGAVDYITKPVSPPIVKARIKTHLALYDQNQALEDLVHKRTIELRETRLAVIQRLGIASEYKDEETGNHIIRMSHYSKIIAKELNLSDEEVELISQAAPMHDVGKIGIPDYILLKPGSLDVKEWEIMKTHTTIGAQIIGDHPSELIRTAKMIALTHHEHWDGSGYPRGLKEEEIPILVRIVTLADVFDSLICERPYKRAYSVEEALEQIKTDTGKLFDPQIVAVFFKSLPKILEIMNQFPSLKGLFLQ